MTALHKEFEAFVESEEVALQDIERALITYGFDEVDAALRNGEIKQDQLDKVLSKLGITR